MGHKITCFINWSQKNSLVSYLTAGVETLEVLKITFIHYLKVNYFVQYDASKQLTHENIYYSVYQKNVHPLVNQTEYDIFFLLLLPGKEHTHT